MKLSVVIVNYNVKYFLEQALLSVRKAASGMDCEIFVVDNNSVDASVEMVREKFPEVIVIANTTNYGFSYANNQAIARAKGEYILLLNPDTIVEEHTFTKVCDFMDATPDAGGLGVKMIDGKGIFLPESKRGLPTPLVAFFKMSGLSRLFPRSRLFGRYHLGFLDNDKTHPVDVLAGAFMLVRKSVFDRIGLLDETFFMYGEDIDLSYRITQAGYRNYYFPETTIIHYKGESTKKTSVNYVFVFYKAMVIFAQKHYSSSYARLFGLFINTAIYFRAFVALCTRFVFSAWAPLLDAAILFISGYLLKTYWEEYHKLVLGGKYPPIYMWVNMSVYVICWLSGIYFSGGYRRNAPFKKIALGVVAGTIAISVLYAFAPDNFRFSRALILLGAATGILLLVGWRLVLYMIRHRSIDYGEAALYNTVIVGDATEAERVRNLLIESHVPHNLLGFVSVSTGKYNEKVIGSVEQLSEIVEVFRISEVIFCASDVASAEIIAWMGRLDNAKVNFKIVPPATLYIIGSNSKDTNGEFYTIEMKLALADVSNQAKKRLFDVVTALCLLLISPLAVWRMHHRSGFFKNIRAVISGRYTWVGYAGNQARDLPRCKPGILTPAHIISQRSRTELSEQVNFQYAKNYRVSLDLDILLKAFRHLGDQ